MLVSALAALLVVPFLAKADPTPLEPSSSSVFNEGGNCTILWTPDATGVWKTMNIELMTGSNLNQIHLRTVATVDGTDSTNHSFSYPCLSVTPNGPIYFYKFSSPDSPNILFTTRFTIADAQSNTVAPTQSETAAGGGLVLWGVGALEDPSQGDQPPVVGTSGASSATSAPASSNTSRSSTRTGTSTATSTSATSSPNGAGQVLPMGTVALGAFGALMGSLFL
ncbi:SubName: Full=Uncharacterized protein {ECO:0000313/EMBL:CCA70739.1} [Serendipita indica DSM 11827]|uniref:Yeast cell wall synthesis Kre9/Knh1-like N-terminal domain-containing protein n=1 Tax=Serendipita indica (strain DSM 11827) TaxID=1109443 RepID=G4THE6_SERID|nr:SubName: Full=Uncharacterized protein {ECO:0000313/EMBL:CCA70739.1} [Serendipita indica DSM 11827]CCA70739.1 hypothetical protein PIIN_04673 [Serendipita indica DSM 11827]